MNSAFGLYLEHSYRYYEMDQPLISDAQFDQLCQILVEGWDQITHRYKHLADIETLKAGTGYQLVGRLHPAFAALMEKYPTRTLSEVFDTMSFEDKFEKQAHDVICMIKFGGIGGTVKSSDIKRVGDYLRGGPLRKALPLPMPKPALPLPLPLPKPKLPLPGQ